MNLYFRLLLLAIRWLAGAYKSIDFFDECKTQFRVNLMDLDLNFHMNNGRFLSVMDLARTDLMVKSGTFRPLFGKGYYPVVVSQCIRFRRSLELFNKFEIRTKLDGWDEYDFYLSQQFWRNGDLVAEGYIKGRFKRRGKKGSIKTHEIFAAAGMSERAQQLSKKANAMNEIEAVLCAKQ